MKQTIIIEIRASEGGNDSKLLVTDLMNIYLKSARNNNFSSKILEELNGFVSVWIEGIDVNNFFKNESGSHSWVRIPPTEKYGRTQTSVITVAIIDPNDVFLSSFNKGDVARKFVRSSGAGGQHINKTSTCCQLTHIPTGIQVKCMDTRDQKKNEEIAWQRLEEKVNKIDKKVHDDSIYSNRFDQVGNSSRSCKKRSYRLKDNLVIDYETGKTATFKDISKGKIELLK